jgi:tRNA threonylcarbamoyladenosine biosynthesis protein TsaE
MNTREYTTISEAGTLALAEKLARNFRGDEVVLLTGELGTGKTVFTKGLAAGLGLGDIHQVCSPSFTLINIYTAKVPIFHMDLYRLHSNAEIYDLGWEDYLGLGIIIIEWAEKLEFEGEAVRVFITVGKDEERIIRIQVPNAKYSLPRIN